MSEAKRFTIMTYGSRGDVEPFIALAAGLQRAGHIVQLVAPAVFGALAGAHGVSLKALNGDPEKLALALTDRAGLSGPRMVLQMVRHVLPMAASVFRAVEVASRGADVLIHSFLLTDAGHTIAVRNEIPDFSAQLFPVFLPTAAFPAVVFPDWAIGGSYRRMTHAVNTAVFRVGGRFLYRKVRAEAPDLPDLAPWAFTDPRGPTPMMCAYSPLVLPRPMDWPAYAQVVGYWRLAAPAGWTPPESLARFLEDGPPPVYFGVGSMRSRRLAELLHMAVEAVKSTGRRALLGVPPDESRGWNLPGQILAVGAIPHDWLFPRTCAVIHHGGAGTTGAALRAGVPSAAVPFTADQAFWGRRIHLLEVGPAPTPARRLTPTRLASIIEEAVANPLYQTRARVLGGRLRQEDGVASAIGLLHRHLGLASPAPEGSA